MSNPVEVLGEVQERYVYPVKGLAGALVPSEVPLPIDEYGVQGSRRWVIIDDVPGLQRDTDNQAG